MAMSEGVIQIFVFRDGAYVGSEMFTEPELVVGNGDDADLRLDDPDMGDAHVIIGREAGRVRVVDLGGPGGTTVNGAPVRHGFVSPRDDIGIGQHRLKVKLVAPRAAPVASPAGAPPSHASQASRPSLPPDAPRPEPRRAPVPPMPPPPGPGAFGNIDDALNSAFGASEDLTARTDMSGVSAAPPTPLPVADLADDALAALDAISALDHSNPGELAASFHGEETEATPMRRAPVGDLFDHEPTVGQHGQPDPRARAPLDDAPRTARARPGPPPAPPPVAPSASARPDAHRPSPRPAPPSMAPRPADAALRPTPTGPVPPIAPPRAEVPAQRLEAEGPFAHPKPTHRAPYYPDEDEIDPEALEAEEAPGFSLVEAIERAGEGSGSEHALQVLTTRDGKAGNISVLERTGSLRFGKREDALVVKMVGPHEARIIAGTSVRLAGPGLAPTNGGDLRIGVGQMVVAKRAGVAHNLRFVRPPDRVEAPASDGSDMANEPVPGSIAAAILVHLFVAIMIALKTSSPTFADVPREVWAEVEPEEPRLVEVPEPPPPEPEPVAEPEPEPEPEPRRAQAPPSPQKTNRRTPKGKPAPEVKKAGVLGALGKLSAPAPGRKSMVQAASSLDAVTTPGGSSFRVGALVAKGPSSDVRLGGGGGGKRLTRGSAELLGGKGFARIGKQSGTKVRGKVARVVTRKVQAQGQMSREEIAKVVNQHIGEIQGCYERALIAEPGLKGKLTLEWTIKTSGQVGAVKQKLSTLKSSAAVNCMMGKVKRWRFPRPRGGIVVASYPFVFSGASY